MRASTSTFTPFQKAVVLMLTASLLFSAMGALVKYATESLPFMEAVFFRAGMSVVLLLPWMLVKRISLFGSHKRLILLRSVSGFIALVAIFFATSRLKLSDAVILNQTSPIFVVLLSGIFLKERLNRRIFLYSGIALLGAALIIKPSGRFFNLAGVVGIASGLFAAISYVTIKRLHQTDSPYSMVFSFAFLSTVASLLFWPSFKLPSGWQWPAVIGIGVLATVAQIMLTKAYHYANASAVSPFSYASVVFSAVWGFLFWREWPDWASALGTAAILVAGIGLMRLHRDTGEQLPSAV